MLQTWGFFFALGKKTKIIPVFFSRWTVASVISFIFTSGKKKKNTGLISCRVVFARGALYLKNEKAKQRGAMFQPERGRDCEVQSEHPGILDLYTER